MVTPNHSMFPCRRAIAIALALMIALVSSPLGASSQGQPPGAGLDLAALVLQPADLAGEGQPGYGTAYGWTMTTVDAMVNPDAFLESRVWMNPATIPNAAAMFTESGWLRFHELMLATPKDPANPDLFHSSASSSIEVYASPDGAATAFAALSTEPALKSGHGGEMTLLPGTTPLGDASVLSAHRFVDEGALHSGVTQIVRIGAVIVSVALLDYGHDIAPDPTLVERLTARLIDRVQAARDSGAAAPPCLPGGAPMLGDAIGTTFAGASAARMPALDRCVQLLSGDTVRLDYAQYLVLDGVFIPRFGMSPDQVATRQTVADTSQTDHTYQYVQGIDGPGGLTRMVVTLTYYQSDEAAAADFAAAEQRLRGNERATVEAFERNAFPLGDETYSYVESYDGSGTVAAGAYTRLDRVSVSVVLIRIDGEPMPGEARAMLTSQVACMQANDCLTPIPVPQALIWGA